jgi:hypothetical protein
LAADCPRDIHRIADDAPAWPAVFVVDLVLPVAGVARRNSKLKKHRAWGLFGISLATAMLFTGLSVAIEGLQSRLDAGYGDAARAFTIVPVTAVLMFAGFVAAAVINLKRPEWHKRLVLLAPRPCCKRRWRAFFLAATGGGPGLRPGLGPPLSIERTMVPGSWSHC